MGDEKLMKKLLSVVMAAVLFICMPGVAFAGDQADAEMSGIISPMYVVISSASCSLNISASGTVNMFAMISCAPTVNKIRMVQYLQRYDGGWQTVDSWSQYYYSNSADWSQSRSVTSGYTYRLYVYFYVYNGTLMLESTTRNSSDTY